MALFIVLTFAGASTEGATRAIKITGMWKPLQLASLQLNETYKI